MLFRSFLGPFLQARNSIKSGSNSSFFRGPFPWPKSGHKSSQAIGHITRPTFAWPKQQAAAPSPPQSLPLASTPGARQFAALPCRLCLQQRSSRRATHDHVKPSRPKLEPLTCTKPRTTALATDRSHVSSPFVPRSTDQLLSPRKAAARPPSRHKSLSMAYRRQLPPSTMQANRRTGLHAPGGPFRLSCLHRDVPYTLR